MAYNKTQIVRFGLEEFTMAIVTFKNSKINFDKLAQFGFADEGTSKIYRTTIVDGQFQMIVNAMANGKLETQVIDSQTGEEYVLHLNSNASGKFVGLVSDEYHEVLDKIKGACYDNDVFKSKQAQEIIKYVNDNYDNQLEFLWKKFPQNAIWRRSDTNKWYGALMTISKSKLGLESEDEVTVLDLRAEPDKIENLIDSKVYFPGYHMNKKNWYSVILNASVDNSDIFKLIKDSYKLAKSGTKHV